MAVRRGVFLKGTQEGSPQLTKEGVIIECYSEDYVSLVAFTRAKEYPLALHCKTQEVTPCPNGYNRLQRD